MPAPPLAHNSQVTFAGGEFSPEMYSRIDLAKYSTGLKTGRNGFVHPQGGFSNRAGLRYVAAAKYSDKKCRLIPFDLSDVQSYMLEVGQGYIRFYVNGAQILLGGLPYEISAPYQEADLPKIKYTQSASTLYLAHPNYPPQTLVRTTDTNWALAAFPHTNGPYAQENTDTTSSVIMNSGFVGGNPVNFLQSTNLQLFAQSQVGDLWTITDIENGQQFSQSLTGGNYPFFYCYKNVTIATTGTWTGSIFIDVFANNAWNVIATLTSASDANFNQVISVPYDYPVLVRARLSLSVTPVVISASRDAYSFSYDVVITQPNATNQVFVKFPNIPPNGGQESPNFGSTEWAGPAWSSVQGYPSAVTFYQDRLGWASTPGNPIGSWWSQTGDYVNYGVSDPLVDSDAISVNMPTRRLNTVKHLLPMYVVLGLTSSGEISIGPGGSGDFSPTSIDLRPQTYHGTADATPVLVGNQAVFVQARSSQVRSIQYQYFTNIFTGEILNLYSTHLFENYSIVDMTYAESPYALIFAVRSDGELLCFTYLPEQQVMAWTHWDTGLSDSFESCAVIPATTYDELWVVVNRTNGRFIERLAQRLPTANTPDQFHVDCGIDYLGTINTMSTTIEITPSADRWNLISNAPIFTLASVGQVFVLQAPNGDQLFCTVTSWFSDFIVFATPSGPVPTSLLSVSVTTWRIAVTSISGLDYLDGQSVVCLADGNVQGPFTVVGGSITLNVPATTVHIGLPYTSDLETLNVELPSQDGTSQGRRQRVAQVTIRFKDSLGGYVGPNSSKMHPIIPNPPPALDSYRPLFTGDVLKIPIPPDWQSNGRIFFRQTDPLPFTITGVFPVTEAGNI